MHSHQNRDSSFQIEASHSPASGTDQTKKQKWIFIKMEEPMSYAKLMKKNGGSIRKNKKSSFANKYMGHFILKPKQSPAIKSSQTRQNNSQTSFQNEVSALGPRTPPSQSPSSSLEYEPALPQASSDCVANTDIYTSMFELLIGKQDMADIDKQFLEQQGKHKGKRQSIPISELMQ